MRIFSLTAHLRYTLIHSLMLIKLKACVGDVHFCCAAWHDSGFERSISTSGIALANRGASTMASRVGCRSVPVWTTCTGAGRHDLLPTWTHDDSCNFAHSIVSWYKDIHHLFSHVDTKWKYFVPMYSKILFCYERENLFCELRSQNHFSDATCRCGARRRPEIYHENRHNSLLRRPFVLS